MNDASPCRVYGLGVWCDREIPRLSGLPVAPRTNVRIWTTSEPPWVAALADDGWREWYRSPFLDDDGRPVMIARRQSDVVRMDYSDGYTFHLDDVGTRVHARGPEGATIDDISSYLLGPVLGLLLRLRGTVCLHASAVGLDERAVAFLGIEGAGKSTTAAALAARGATVISDDLVPLHDIGDGFVVPPGYARLRLWPASVRLIAAMRPGSAWADAGCDGRYHLDVARHGFRFETRALPLAAIYVLDQLAPGGRPGVEPLPAHDALMTLVANTFANRTLERDARAREFELLGRSIERVPVFSLKALRGVEHLSALCDLVLAHSRALMTLAPAGISS